MNGLNPIRSICILKEEICQEMHVKLVVSNIYNIEEIKIIVNARLLRKEGFLKSINSI